MVTRGWGRAIGNMLAMGSDLEQVDKCVPGELMHNIVLIDNNTVL